MILSNMVVFIFFFFKQKTAYEITRRDWSSDVCSSDLPAGAPIRPGPHGDPAHRHGAADLGGPQAGLDHSWHRGRPVPGRRVAPAAYARTGAGARLRARPRLPAARSGAGSPATLQGGRLTPRVSVVSTVYNG